MPHLLTVHFDDHRHAEALLKCAEVGIEGCPDRGVAGAAIAASAAIRRAIGRATRDWRSVLTQHMESDQYDRDVLIAWREPAGSRDVLPEEEVVVGGVVGLSEHAVRLRRPRDGSLAVVPLRWIENVEVSAS